MSEDNNFNHFEEIWNEAEAVGEQIEGNVKLSQYLLRIQEHAKELNNKLTLEEKNKEFGEILWNLCQVARLIPINSDAILKLIVNERRAKNARTNDSER